MHDLNVMYTPSRVEMTNIHAFAFAQEPLGLAVVYLYAYPNKRTMLHLLQTHTHTLMQWPKYQLGHQRC